MARFDLYGFDAPDLDAAAAAVERPLGIRLRLRDSSYRGLYYAASERSSRDYLLERNGGNSRWHAAYPAYGVTLMISNLPDMDVIREKLTSGGDGPTFLRSIIHPDEDPSDSP